MKYKPIYSFDCTMREFRTVFQTNAYVGWTSTHGMYYPPDFDPSKLKSLRSIQRGQQALNSINGKRSKNNKQLMEDAKTHDIRMAFPYSMTCNVCNHLHAAGTKFLSRVASQPRSYLGKITIFTVSGKCTECTNKFQFRTDPATRGYIMCYGGSFCIARDVQVEETQFVEVVDINEDELIDPMERVEAKVQADRQRLDARFALEETARKVDSRTALFYDFESTLATKDNDIIISLDDWEKDALSLMKEKQCSIPLSTRLSVDNEDKDSKFTEPDLSQKNVLSTENKVTDLSTDSKVKNALVSKEFDDSMNINSFGISKKIIEPYLKSSNEGSISNQPKKVSSLFEEYEDD